MPCTLGDYYMYNLSPLAWMSKEDCRRVLEGRDMGKPTVTFRRCHGRIVQSPHATRTQKQSNPRMKSQNQKGARRRLMIPQGSKSVNQRRPMDGDSESDSQSQCACIRSLFFDGRPRRSPYILIDGSLCLELDTSERRGPWTITLTATHLIHIYEHECLHYHHHLSP